MEVGDSGLPRNCGDKITKFHDLLIDLHISWILKSGRVAPPIHENQELGQCWVSTALATFACKRKPLTVYFVCKIPFFHDFFAPI